MCTSSSKQHFALALILLLSAYLRWPFLSEGLPYFYDEDEAHHHNRVVNMVKKGTFDPEYFHKPSLHFYVRMPFVAAGFLTSPKDPHTPPRIESISTSDPFGIGGYAFTTDQEQIVKWNRLASLLISLAVIALSFAIITVLSGSVFYASAAALFVCFSPDMLTRSATVAVDMLMTMNCLLATYCALLAYRKKNLYWLLASAAAVGLAMSSKYNAFPALSIPMLTAFQFSNRSKLLLVAFCLFTSGVFFLLGSPFILSHIPTFLNQVAYEQWHYGTAGHVGHTGEPGMAQLFFYIGWLGHSAMSWLIVLLVLIGVCRQLLSRSVSISILLCYPVLFLLYMSMQRVNFERNMISIIPYCAILASISLLWISTLRWSWAPKSAAILAAIALTQPILGSLAARESLASTDTRDTLTTYLQDSNGLPGKVALAGELWLRPATYRLPNAVRVQQQDLTLLELQQQGVEFLVVGNLDSFAAFDAFGEVVKDFGGALRKQRVLNNPNIRLYKLSSPDKAKESLQRDAKTNAHSRRVLKWENGKFHCTDGNDKALASEGYCWTERKLIAVHAQKNNRGTLEVASPWQGQVLRIFDSRFHDIKTISLGKPWEWTPLALPDSEDVFYFETKIIQSPGLTDPRLLGVAIR